MLCLAEGQGRNAVFLAGLGHSVTAMDRSAVGVERARALAREREVEVDFGVGDLATWSVGEGCWDAIVSVFAHVPPALRRDLHRRVVAGLAPGGRFLLEAYTPRQLEYGTGGPPDVELLMSLPELQAELEGLVIEVGRELEREVIEGVKHTGLAHVVQIVARAPDDGEAG